jgi:hypothetical protein
MMMNAIRISSKLLVLTLIIIISASGCKSKKKAMEAAAAEKARTEQEALKRQQEEQARKDAEDKARREAEARQNDIRSNEPKAKLLEYFNAIAASDNVTSANNSINEALALFASPDAPVLIVISETGGQKDYDRPTTIRNYLNYLKDQKKNMNRISDVRFNDQGKITEVELRKN